MTSTLTTFGPAGSRMMVLDSEISQVSYARDFGCIEAMVTLFVKEAGQPLRPLRFRTHVRARGATPVRERLIADAHRMMEHRLQATEAELPTAA